MTVTPRAGEFERAETYIVAGSALPEVPAFVTKLLLYQRELVQARDTGRHTVADVDEPGDSRATVH